jgi:holo-[acyl-carrier protein] synthase
MIVGHGVDVQDVGRVRKLLSYAEDDFRISTFTEAERAIECGDQELAEFLAGRLAAKEAVAKALGTGIAGEIAFLHIEIVRKHGGQPEARLYGPARNVADALGVTRWLVSISHTDHVAFASVIAVHD